MVGAKKRQRSGEYFNSPPRNWRKTFEPDILTPRLACCLLCFEGTAPFEKRFRPAFQRLMCIWQELPASEGAYLAMKETALPCCSAISLTPCLNSTCMSAIGSG